MKETISQWLSAMFQLASSHSDAPRVSAQKIKELLDDVRLVGQQNLVGYLPISTITDICHEDPQVLQKIAENKGLKTIMVADRPDKHFAALFVYDPANLQNFLDIPGNKKILQQHDWPANTEGFMKNVIEELAPKGPLFDLVALAFNDHRYRNYNGYAGGPERLPPASYVRPPSITAFPGTP